MESLPRTPVSGPTFIRLLARMSDASLPADGLAPAEQLGQWIDWTRAVALSRALDGTPAPTTPADAGDVAEDCLRARASLAAAIAAGDQAGDADAFAPFREYCLRQQRAMQASTGRLRGRLRDHVAAASPALARLAEVDATMEATLSPREHALLASVPDLLCARFAHLRRGALEGATDLLTRPASDWRAGFRHDMRDVLLAELDLRIQPIEGLLAALHAR